MSDLMSRIISDRYRVVSFVGRGGMAEVYKVWDTQRSVHLAMKILHADIAHDKVFLRRFRREAKMLSQLQHPNIVRYYSLERDGRLVYMLMDYVEGYSLKQEIFDSPGPLTYERILQLMRPICAALYYAHQQGFVHCDVKPGNILIDNRGRIYVSDFGIARMTETATATMVGVGTPAYMAPEQVRGDNPTVQTDIYMLGILLFEMLTGGERPFIGESARISGSTNDKVRWEQINSKPPSLQTFNPAISLAMEALVFRCLEKEPGRRFDNVQDLYANLEAALQTPSVAATPSMSPEDKTTVILHALSAERISKRPTIPGWIAAVVGGTALVLVIGMCIMIGFQLSGWFRPTEITAPIPTATLIASLSPVLSPTVAPVSPTVSSPSPSPTVEESTNALPATPTINCSPLEPLIVRRDPSTLSEDLGNLECGQTVTLTGRYFEPSDREWFQIWYVDANDQTISAWVIASRVDVMPETRDNLPILGYYGVPITSEPAHTNSVVQCIYTLRPGDYFSQVANKFGIGEDNYTKIYCAPDSLGCDLTNPAFIQPGWRVIIPGVQADVCVQHGGELNGE